MQEFRQVVKYYGQETRLRSGGMKNMYHYAGSITCKVSPISLNDEEGPLGPRVEC